MRGEIGGIKYEVSEGGLVLEPEMGLDIFLDHEALEELAEVIKEVLDDE